MLTLILYTDALYKITLSYLNLQCDEFIHQGVVFLQIALHLVQVPANVFWDGGALFLNVDQCVLHVTFEAMHIASLADLVPLGPGE